MHCHRRAFLGLAGALVVTRSAAAPDAHAFVAAAQRMKEQAIAAGDQPFGAVVVKDGMIVGHGPSRVLTDRNPDAHAERVAIWDAQKRLATADLSGAVLYSTSRPCAAASAWSGEVDTGSPSRPCATRDS